MNTASHILVLSMWEKSIFVATSIAPSLTALILLSAGNLVMENFIYGNFMKELFLLFVASAPSTEHPFLHIISSFRFLFSMFIIISIVPWSPALALLSS